MTDSALPGAARRFRNGLLDDNPIYRQLLGMCPTLAVTATLAGAVTMAGATAFVMIMASVVVALLKNQLKGHLRILVFTLTIATFVTIIDRVLQAYVFEMSLRLGSYIPLIIVNCIIICRAEACASKNNLFVSIIDALGMGVGFTLTLCVLAGVREVLSTGAIWEIKVSPDWFVPWAAIGMPAGAFITLGLLLGLVNVISKKQK